MTCKISHNNIANNIMKGGEFNVCGTNTRLLPFDCNVKLVCQLTCTRRYGLRNDLSSFSNY